MNNAIIIENIAKKYLINHHDRVPYLALRDMIADGAHALSKRIFSHHSNPSLSSCEEFWALRDVSFDVKQGERVGIIGRNGAGKSTLLKILSRITDPTAGRVRIRGRVASLLEVGTGFHPELTGRENIFLNGAILGMSRVEIKKKFNEIVDFAEIEKFLDTPVKRYSSGMYVRLAFAVAAHLEPEILIVDEVLAVGDAHFQKKCLGKMEQVGKEGRTVLFVSHNMGIVQELCGRGILLDAGNMVYSGAISETVSRYLAHGAAPSEFEVVLTDHANRLASMKKYLKKIVIKNDLGLPVRTFRQLDSIFIELEYDTQEAVNLSGAGFIISSQEGIRVGGGNTYMSFMPPYKIPPKGKVVFSFSAKQFTPGYYTITVSLGSHQAVLEDKIENAIGFTIDQADIYGTGYLLTKEDGVVALNFESTVEAIN